jgi:hypothetical protein
MATPTNLPATAVSGEILTAAYVNALRGAFRVLQVKHMTSNGQQTHNSLTYTSTGLTLSITPQATTSKILVVAFVNGTVKGAEDSGNALCLNIVRGATQIQEVKDLHLTNTAILLVGTCFMQALDSPATTSSTTYTINGRNSRNGSSVATQFNGVTSSLILMEISE